MKQVTAITSAAAQLLGGFGLLLLGVNSIPAAKVNQIKAQCLEWRISQPELQVNHQPGGMKYLRAIKGCREGS